MELDAMAILAQPALAIFLELVTGGVVRSDGHVRDAQAANIGVELDFDHPILAAPEIVMPEMLYGPPCPI
jgi:hypothetical protein